MNQGIFEQDPVGIDITLNATRSGDWKNSTGGGNLGANVARALAYPSEDFAAPALRLAQSNSVSGKSRPPSEGLRTVPHIILANIIKGSQALCDVQAEQTRRETERNDGDIAQPVSRMKCGVA